MRRRSCHRAVLPFFGAVLLACSQASAALADEPAADPSLVAGGWSFKLTPYVWFAALDGDIRTRRRFPVTHVDESFSDIIENTDMAFMVLGEARHDKFGVLLDLDYLDLSDSAQTPGELFGDAKASSEALIGTLALAYRVLEQDGGTVDVLGGGRLWSIDNEVKFSAGRLPAVSTSEDETWIDPIIGLRGDLVLNDQFFLKSYADIGGFGAGSEFTWQVLVTMGYRFNDSLTAELGWRYLSVDYDDDGFLWDVDLNGPLLGLSYKF